MSSLISVIVAVYNVEEYLDECIKSILKQTHQDFELILVNDGSTDQSGAICDLYAKENERIHVIHQENKGPSGARNAGIDQARGMCIAFIDSDDWVHPTYLEVLFQRKITHDADIVACDFKRMQAYEISDIEEDVNPLQFTKLESLKALYGPFDTALAMAAGKLYDQKIFKTLRFHEGTIHEDELIIYQAIDLAQKVVFTREKLYYYRLRPNSITGIGFHPQGSLQKIQALMRRVAYFDAQGLMNLSALTFPIIFEHVVKVYHHRHELEQAQNELFLEIRQDIKKAMRKHRLPYKFKLYYELHYVAPNFSRLLKKV